MLETRLKIRLFGASELRKKARPIKQVTPLQRQILSEMAQLMYEAGGIGLAAPQVGINEAMILTDIGTGLYKLINPKIVKKEGSQVMEEGCLSVPGICIKVKRARKIEIQAQDEFAKPLTLEAEGLLACVLQHEIDHLKGKLIVDYASFLKRLKIGRKLKEIKKLRLRLSTSTRSILSEQSESKERSNEELPESKTKSCQLQL